MLEVCTTTGFYSTSTILVTLAKSVCVTSTSSATSSTVRSWTSTSYGPWSLRMLRTRQPRILCRWSMSLSSGTSKFLGRGFCLRSNQSLSRPSLFRRLPRRRLKRLVGLLCLLLRWGFLRFCAVLDFVKFKRLVILLDRLILWILYVFLINLLVLAYLWLCLLHSWPGRIELIVWWCEFHCGALWIWNLTLPNADLFMRVLFAMDIKIFSCHSIFYWVNIFYWVELFMKLLLKVSFPIRQLKFVCIARKCNWVWFISQCWFLLEYALSHSLVKCFIYKILIGICSDLISNHDAFCLWERNRKSVVMYWLAHCSRLEGLYESTPEIHFSIN